MHSGHGQVATTYKCKSANEIKKKKRKQNNKNTFHTSFTWNKLIGHTLIR